MRKLYVCLFLRSVRLAEFLRGKHACNMALEGIISERRDQNPAFEMRPDATIISSSRNPESIYDAKWKRLDVTTQNAGVNRSDIYQMASYASGYGCRHVTLVFPSSDKVAAGLVETFEISDPYASRVDVFALDLHALALGAALPDGLGPES